MDFSNLGNQRVAGWLGMVAIGFYAVTASAQQAVYHNLDRVVEPPIIDAVTFINDGTFTLGTFVIGPVPVLFFGLADLFDTSSTLNFTNRNQMSSFPGFRFDWASPTQPVRRMAANFHNAGQINPFNANVHGGLQLRIAATNVVNRGRLSAGSTGLVRIEGHNLDLYRSVVETEGIFGGATVGSDFWAVGDIDVEFENFLAPQSPPHTVEFLLGGGFVELEDFIVSAAGGETHAHITGPPLNRLIQIVFIRNFNPEFASEVRFVGGVPTVQWRAEMALPGTDTSVTNFIVFSDRLAVMDEDDVELFPDDDFIDDFGAVARQPNNYSLFLSQFPDFLFEFFGEPGNEIFTPAIFGEEDEADDVLYTSWGATVGGGFFPIATGALTNRAGRIELAAKDILNVRRARIEATEFISVQATNHFVGQAAEGIDAANQFLFHAPHLHLKLGSTNGVMDMSRLVPPVLPRVRGGLNVWSSTWETETELEIPSPDPDTDPETVTQTNRYHVIVLDAAFALGVVPEIHEFDVRIRNVAAPSDPTYVTIGNLLNLSGHPLIEVDHLTISEEGAINILTNLSSLGSAFPRLQTFTNHGGFFIASAVSLSAPQDALLGALVNSGQMQAASIFAGARYFENSGTLVADVGPMSIVAEDLVLSGSPFDFGFISALSADLSFEARRMTISNSAVDAAKALGFRVTEHLSDGVARTDFLFSPRNSMSAGEGIHLLAKPATGDLLGTEITSRAFVNRRIAHLWAGEDRGRSVAGFSNNVAIGRLILDGDAGSLFEFIGATGGNALYVDYLEFRNFTTNRNDDGRLSGLVVDPSIRIYFAASNLPEDKLEEGNSGLVWVSEYAGVFSSARITYPSGITHQFNRGLLASCTIDSNGNGIPNCEDPIPILTADSVMLSASIVEEPTPTVFISWQAPANSVSTLYYQNRAGGSWKALTNLTQGAVSGRLTVPDPIAGSGSRFYRVGIEQQQ